MSTWDWYHNEWKDEDANKKLADMIQKFNDGFNKKIDITPVYPVSPIQHPTHEITPDQINQISIQMAKQTKAYWFHKFEWIDQFVNHTYPKDVFNFILNQLGS
jgi:hypothetical protein